MSQRMPDYDALRERQARAQEPADVRCPVCGVGHRTTMADLSHGIIRLIQHAQGLRPWEEWPISGDGIARQRAGIRQDSLLFSVYWDEEDHDERNDA